jgi:PTH1 family peptidyl-tRNA hydrolase
MKLIVGLGNPGSEYKNTRHNIGFSLLDFIANSKNLVFDKVKFNGKYTTFYCGDEKVIMLKPLSFMNLSGGVVKCYVDYFKIDYKDILIIQDDLDMSFGKIKIVFNSSSGGHNGIKDIERNLGSREYARLKIGIANDKRVDTKDYVLGKFSKDELEILDSDYNKLISVVDDFCNMSLDRLMNKYNNK